MLNGIDPVIIFSFKKLLPQFYSVPNIPVVSQVTDAVPLPPIPIYLSETVTGLYIDSEDKSVEIETSTETTADGKSAVANQKGIQSTIKINMVANSESLGLVLLSALIDLLFQKVTSKEYSISYFHSGVVIFDGLLHSYNVTNQAGTTLSNVTLEISRSTAKPAETNVDQKIPVVEPIANPVSLE